MPPSSGYSTHPAQLEQNVLVMKKSQSEKKNYAFHAVFRVDVNDVKPFQNPTKTSSFDHLLDP